MSEVISKPESKLAEALAGRFSGELRDDRLARAIYATDASIYEIPPAAVAFPRGTEDVVALVKGCGQTNTPLIGRGAGTGIAGAALGEGVVVDFSRHMNAIIEIDAERRLARVQPGVVLDDLNAALLPHGLHFPPDVATSSRATIGGMINNNSCGSHSVYYGRTVDFVEALTVVLADASVVAWRQQAYADLPADVNGRVPQRPIWGDARPREARPVDRRDGGLQEAERIGAAIARPCHTEQRILETLNAVRSEYREEVLVRYPRVLRRNGGYALERLCLSEEVNPATLICGSEGTLGLVVEATLRLAPLPAHRALAVLHFDDLFDAIGATPLVLRHKPAAVELVDHLILTAGAPRIPEDVRTQFMTGLPRAVLICELYDDDAGSLRQRMAALDDELRRERVGQPARLVFDPQIQAAVWVMRNKGFGLLMSRPGERQPHEFIEDAAVDPSQLRDYIRELNAMLAEEGVTEVAHYAHASVGVLHVRPTLSLKDPRDRVRLRRISERTAELVLKYGGALTGEHGDGIVRSEFLPRMYGARIVEAFGKVKRAFDPTGIFNPGKIVEPWPMDRRLRGGKDQRIGGTEDRREEEHRSLCVIHAAKPGGTQAATTYLDFSAYGGMSGLAEMCSGVGQCRQKLVGTMCPSYMATLDETHTTRARANALRVALSDRGLIDGLADPALNEVMELCISCKACKSECPTGVDMAKLKAEWLAARVKRRGASRADRFFAQAARAARGASRWPRIANAVMRMGWVRGFLERAYGLERRVAAPRFTAETFWAWWKRREPREVRNARGRAVYFVDTWMNAYWPSVGVAAVELLERAGYEVVVPELVCCGRPLISRGFLDEAAALARENVRRLAGMMDERTWIVGSEPSCVLTLMDEGPQFVRTEEGRRIAGRVKLVESLLVEGMARLSATTTTGAQTKRVLVHGHCHQKALVGTGDALKLLNAIPGIEASEINSGCCGMAGSFGHETGHYEVSKAIGEQRLFPAVRNHGAAEIAVCGFSCREQVGHHTGVAARHVLEVAAEALRASAK